MQFTTSVIKRSLGKSISFGAAIAVALGLATGISSSALAADDNITVTGSIASTITLELPVKTIAFGVLTPNNLPAAGAGITAATDTNGTSYVYDVTGSVKVRSNAAWSGNVVATMTAPSLTTSDLSLVSGSTSSAFGGPVAFGTGIAGDSSYAHDYGLRVDWTDTTGAFSATIVYTVTNA